MNMKGGMPLDMYSNQAIYRGADTRPLLGMGKVLVGEREMISLV